MRLIPLLVSCLISLTFLPPAAYADREEARTKYKTGLRAYRAGKLDQALDLFMASEDADPTYPFPTFALGRVYQQLFDQETRHYQDAAEAYERLALLLRIEPPPDKHRGLYQGHYFRGLLYLKGGDYEKALEALRVFQELEPNFSNLQELHNAIGIALYYVDQYDKAVEEFQRALVIDPEYAEAAFNLRSVFTRLAAYNEAVAISRVGELEMAMEKVQQLKEYAPRYLPLRRLEAKIFEAQGRENDALRVYSEVLGVDRRHPITYHIRLQIAKILRKKAQPAAAIAMLEQNLDLFPVIADKRLERECLDYIETLKAEL